MPSITLNNVSKRYGNRLVFDSISFRINPGRVYVVLGANGSGKTTLLRLLCSLTKPDQGEILIETCKGVRNPYQARDWVGVVSDDISLYEELTAFENIEFFARLRNCRVDSIEYLKRFGLEQRAYDTLNSYSSGMKQRMALAFSLLHEPSILLLDEPTVNLDAEGVRLVHAIIDEWKGGNKVVVLATNDPREAEELGDIFLEIKDAQITCTPK